MCQHWGKERLFKFHNFATLWYIPLRITVLKYSLVHPHAFRKWVLIVAWVIGISSKQSSNLSRWLLIFTESLVTCLVYTFSHRWPLLAVHILEIFMYFPWSGIYLIYPPRPGGGRKMLRNEALGGMFVTAFMISEIPVIGSSKKDLFWLRVEGPVHYGRKILATGDWDQ